METSFIFKFQEPRKLTGTEISKGKNVPERIWILVEEIKWFKLLYFSVWNLHDFFRLFLMTVCGLQDINRVVLYYHKVWTLDERLVESLWPIVLNVVKIRAKNWMLHVLFVYPMHQDRQNIVVSFRISTQRRNWWTCLFDEHLCCIKCTANCQ